MFGDRTEKLLDEIGNVLAIDITYPLEGTFLYAEVQSQVTAASIFKDLGDHLLFRWPMNELHDILLDLWESEPSGRRWAAMEYRIDGDKFTASFTYPEELDPAESNSDRRERILQRRYGNKRIVYPAL
jgi:hypothetical protein